jgi:gliding motility-associated-like protein
MIMKRLLTILALFFCAYFMGVSAFGQCTGTPPDISICPSPSPVNTNPGQCSYQIQVTDNWYPNGVSDVEDPIGPWTYSLTVNLNGTSYSYGPLPAINLTSLPPLPKGLNTFFWTVTDPDGCSDNCFYQVTVVDNIPPVLSSISNKTPNATATDAATCKYVHGDNLWNPVATDNCPGVEPPTYTVTGPGGASPSTGTSLNGVTFNLGVSTVTWTVSDNASPANTSTSSFTVTVVDGTPPVIPTIADATGQCTVTVTAPTTTDNCAGTITGTTANPLTYNTQGTHTITWSFTDGVNTVTATQNVIVDDTQPPAIPTIASATGQCTVTVIAPTTTDNCAGTITGTTSDPLTYNTQGTHTITWSFTDGNGQTVTTTQTVIVDDTQPPAVPTIANETGQCSVTVTAPTTTDICAGTITGTTTDPLTYNAQGTFSITWSFTDGNGQTVTATQTVIVDDTAPPVIPTLAVATGECSVTVVAPTTTDICAGIITGTTSSPLVYTVQGTYSITWSFTDGNGQTVTATQSVIVDDVTSPVIPTIANATGECSVTVPIPTTTDNCLGTVNGTTTSPLVYNAEGTYSITWSFTDGNGQTVTATQSVIVDDVTPPIIPTIADAVGQCSVTVPVATTTDNCLGTVNGTTTSPLVYTAQGTYSITWTFTDGNGQTVTATQAVIVDDTTPPAIPTIANASGECSATAAAPTTTDNCSGTITGTTTDALTYNTQGAHIITWSFTDNNGQTVTATQTVLVDDITSPVPNVASLPTITAQCTANPSIPTATDNCVGAVTATTTTVFPVSASTTIIWVYDDGNGNTTTQTQNIVINDVTAPDPTVASLPTITGECPTLTTPTATDNCLGLISATTSSPTSFNTDGTYIVTWTYTDGNNNSSTQLQIVIVNDITAPVPDVASLPNIVGSCTNLIPPTATDACKGSITATTSNPLSYTIDGTYAVTWTYSDGNGNSVTQTQTVIVDDIIAPVPNVANIDYVGTCITLTAPTATDACVGPVTGTTTDPTTYNVDGTHIVTWTYSDGNGNTSTQLQYVVVDDVTAPVPAITSLPNLTAQCSITPTAPTATDNCYGTVTATTATTFPITTQGTTLVTWVYDDGNSNTTTQTQTVIIDDITAPVPNVASLPNLTGECSVTVTTIPTSTDNCVGLLTASTSNPLIYNTQGTYTITWSYDDFNGNISTQTQTVIVDDVTAPIPNVASLPTLTGECSVNVTVTPTAIDNCIGAVTATTTSPLNYTVEGTYVITWTYNDGNGNVGTQTQTVIVDDITAPVPNIASLPDVSEECVTLTPPVSTDNCEGNITASTADPLSYNSDGTYIVTWTYDDGNGNTTTQTQNVFIDDVTAPVPTQSNIDYSGECVTLTVPTASDNCVGQIDGTTTDPITYDLDGTYVVTWTFDDGNGNSATQTQTVIVNDISIPVIPILSNAVAQCDTTISAPVALDNCVGSVTGTTSDPLTYSNQGTYTITWVFDDTNGNTVTATQTVIIDDVTNPTIAAPATVDVYPNTIGCVATGIDLGVPTTADNCQVTSVVNNGLSVYPLGSTTVIWTVTDIGGNIATATQIVNVLPPASTIDTVACDTYVAPDGLDLTDSGSGTYTVVLEGASTFGCDSTITINLTLNQSTTSTITLSACETYTAPDGAVYENSGQYTAIIQNVAGCDSTITINLTIDSIETTAIELNDLVFSALQGTQVQYQWISCDNGYSAINGATQQSFDVSQYPLPSGNYAVVLTNNTCVDTSECVNISIETIIPQLVTPNGDGNNDVFEIQGIYDHPNNVLEIYNRWGSLVYRQEGYQNTWGGECTEGLSFGGNILPTGTYFYILDLGDNDGAKPSKGYIFLTK